ncbi:MAG TPA: Hsp20/alpha crystallin family protein, partial [Dehalococcoidia bacterium]|nr:Hsp20/alpha crystallin family protein [Dehalococcoidia bacterium]
MVITASLPGLRTDEIRVTIEDGALSIAAEKATETEES